MAEKEITLHQSKKAEWEKDMVWIKFMNLRRAGESIAFTVNGRVFYLKHGQIVKVPRAVMSALETAIDVRWKVEDVDIRGFGGKKPVSYEDPRFGVLELSEEQAMRMMPKKQREEQEVISDIINTQTARPEVEKKSKQSMILDELAKEAQ